MAQQSRQPVHPEELALAQADLLKSQQGSAERWAAYVAHRPPPPPSLWQRIKAWFA